jgi:hypothetical protein
VTNILFSCINQICEEAFHNIKEDINIIRVIKSRRMRLAGYVVRMGEMRNTVYWLENPKGKVHLEDLCIDGKITLEWILEK